MDYVKKDCPKCKTIHTLILKANNIVKCPSCLGEWTLLNVTNRMNRKLNKKIIKSNIELSNGIKISLEGTKEEVEYIVKSLNN